MTDDLIPHTVGDRRSFLYGAGVLTAAALTGGLTAFTGLGRPMAASAAGSPTGQVGLAPDIFCRAEVIDRSRFRYATGSDEWAQTAGRGHRKVSRKSASQMTAAEIDRFRRAFEWAVARGYMDVFNDEHFDHARHRQHGADVLAGSPPAVSAGLTVEWGYRLLPWHRSFLIEAEQMLRAALHERCRRERRDTDEANLVFLPYWDATHDRRLPRWVERMRPRGGTALVPPDLPPGHAGYGKPVGSRYNIEFNRWPAGWLAFRDLPPAAQFGRIIDRPDFVGFYQALDLVPEVVPENGPAARAALALLAQKIPDDPYLQTILAFLDPAYPKDPVAQLNAFNAFLALGHRASIEDAKPRREKDKELIAAILAVYSAFRMTPHALLHFWAGGLSPRNPNIRGTVTYFNELCVDPVFWMLHNELDRLWWTWSTQHAGGPPLADEWDVFEPLLPAEAEWYGGGRTYHTAELMDLDTLPYSFDRLYTV